MKKCTILILTLCLLFCIAGCAAPAIETAPPTVADLFDNTATTPSEELDAPDAAMVSLGFGLMGDFVTDETNRRLYLYHGGEMRLGYWMEAEGYSNMGLGMFLFVDGQPQPFKTESDGTERYMHILYPPEGEKITGQFLFTPASGEQGDTLEIYTMHINYPAHSIDDPPGAYQTFGAGSEDAA